MNEPKVTSTPDQRAQCRADFHIDMWRLALARSCGLSHKEMLLATLPSFHVDPSNGAGVLPGQDEATRGTNLTPGSYCPLAWRLAQQGWILRCDRAEPPQPKCRDFALIFGEFYIPNPELTT